MKPIFLVVTILFSTLLFSQKINSENYYDFYSTKENLKGKQLVTAWLDEVEASQILAEEMENAGFEWISNFRIIKLSKNEYISAICFSDKSIVGFVYEPIHGAIPKKENRELKSLYKKMTKNDYAEKIVDINGDSQFIKIKELPENIQIIKEDIYWYQYTDNPEDDKYLVSKEEMIDIFRSDVRKLIANFKK